MTHFFRSERKQGSNEQKRTEHAMLVIFTQTYVNMYVWYLLKECIALRRYSYACRYVCMYVMHSRRYVKHLKCTNFCYVILTVSFTTIKMRKIQAARMEKFTLIFF